MRKRFAIACLAGMMVVFAGGLAEAADITWIHQCNNIDTEVCNPNDQGFVDVLESAGHVVTRDNGLYQDGNGGEGPGPHVDTLNAQDLLIFSLETSSGRYDGGSGDPDLTIWNDITTPTIFMSPWMARGNRHKWLNTETVNQASVPNTATMTATDPNHPLFSNGVLDGNNQWRHMDQYEGDVNGGLTSVGNGTLLATIDGVAADADKYIVYWDAGTEFYSGSGFTPAGPRLLLNGGGSSNGTAPAEGAYNLSADGEQILLNAVNWLTPFEGFPGDVNMDNVVDDADLTIIRSNYFKANVLRTDGDLNNDNIVDFLDYRQWTDNDGNVYTPPLSAAAAVPEPTCLGLALLGGVALFGIRRRS